MQPSSVKNLLTGAAVVLVLVAAVTIGFVLGRSGDDAVVTDTTTTTTSTTSSVPEPLPTTTTTSSTIPPPRDFADLFEDLRGAVASVDVVGCDFGSQGTAFLIDEETAYTAWHVVEDAA